VFIVLFIVTWWQGRTLARWLDRIDGRVDPAVRAQPTIIDTLNESVASISLSRDPRRLTAKDWRWMSNWAPILILGFGAWTWWRTGAASWWLLAFIIVWPAMILLSMRRTVRDVGVERSIGLKLHGEPPMDVAEPGH
jgi:hypothetical protein